MQFQLAQQSISRQYHRFQSGPQQIQDDDFFNIQIGDDNQVEQNKAAIVILSEDEQPVQVKNQDQQVKVLQKNEDRQSASQLQNIFKDQSNKHAISDKTVDLQRSLQQISAQHQEQQKKYENAVKQANESLPPPPIQPSQKPTQEQKQQQKRIEIKPKLHFESDDDDEPPPPPKKKQIRFNVEENDDEQLPSMQFRKKPDIQQSLSKKIISATEGLALQITVKTKPQQDNNLSPPTQNKAVSYQDFIALKNREALAAKQRQIDEEIRKKQLQDKKLNKIQPELQRPNESQSQYLQRMIELLKKKNKTKKYKKGMEQNNIQSEEKKTVNTLLQYIHGGPIEEDEPPLPKPEMLNFDVLFKNGLVLKQALQKPPEPDLNPMLNVYKRGRYATEFIFSGGIDFEDGPYGQPNRKKPKKLPFPKHKLSLTPWEYYGVGPEEYFKTKNPNFEFKQRYVPISEYYNEMPRPKPTPKYFQYQVEQLLAKRFHGPTQEIQYQASYVGYQKKHWTPLSHLREVCPNAVMEYEKYERDRIFCEVINVKCWKVQAATSYCILSARIVKRKREPPQVQYWKGEEEDMMRGQMKKQTISNLEQQIVNPESQKLMELQFTDDEDEQQKKKISKEQKHLEDLWDPEKDDTARAIRSKLRREKFNKIADELKSQEQKQEKKKNNIEQQSTDPNKETKKKKKSKKKLQNIDEKQALEQEVNQFEEQFKQQLKEQQQNDDDEVYHEPEDVLFKSKIQDLNVVRSNDLQNDISKLDFGNNKNRLESDRYMVFQPK